MTQKSPKAVFLRTSCGLCALVVALLLGGEVQAGLMLSNDAGANSAAAAPSEGVADLSHEASQSPGDGDSERQHDLESLLSQRAGGEGGATGASTSATGSLAAMALLKCECPIAERLLGFCLDFENSVLPASPAFDLLKPPQARV